MSEDLWGERTPYGPGEDWPVRVDENVPHSVDSWAQGASLLHSNGDAMDIAVKDGKIAGVRGRAGDRVNKGRSTSRTATAGRPTTIPTG